MAPARFLVPTAEAARAKLAEADPARQSLEEAVALGQLPQRHRRTRRQQAEIAGVRRDLLSGAPIEQRVEAAHRLPHAAAVEPGREHAEQLQRRGGTRHVDLGARVLRHRVHDGAGDLLRVHHEERRHAVLREPLGRGEPGIHARHADPLRRQFVGDGLAEGDDRVLARGVDGMTGRREAARERGDVHDVAAAALEEHRQERARRLEHAEDVHADHLLDLLGGEAVEASAARDARVVDEHVDASVALAHGRGEIPVERRAGAEAIAVAQSWRQGPSDATYGRRQRRRNRRRHR